MTPLRVLSIFGTRPEAVKMAPVIQQLVITPGVDSKVCVTAQHRQMLDQVLSLFGIQPDIDLNLMRPNQTLAELTADIFTHLDPVIRDIKPDWVLVQGDTTTVMAAGLLAYYSQIRVGHIEAGLRTGNRWQPFPEEINRRVAGVVADLHFAPTQLNRQHLLHEGIPAWRILVTGNPVIDALNQISQLPQPSEVIALLEKLKVSPTDRRLILVTAHRRENFGNPLINICLALRSLAEMYPENLQLVYPVHLNPNVHEPVYRLLSGIPNITLLPPLDYLPMVHLMKRSTLVLTDSGGIQEEATALQIPALVLRQVTERPEGVETGILRLVGTDPQHIITEATRLLDDCEAYQVISTSGNPFGDGHAAQRIVAGILNFHDQDLRAQQESV